MCNFGERMETIFRKHTEQSNSCWRFFKKASMWKLEQLKTNTLLPSGLRSHVFFSERKKSIRVNYRWNTPFSLSCGGLNWCTVAPCQTETGGTTFAFSFSPWALHKTDALPIHPVLLPVSRVSDAVLKPYALLNSTRILPSRPIPAVLCWPRTLGCREGGLHASCVGSKYLHSPSSRVARRRGLDVLGYVKSNPPGRIFNRLSLLEQIFEQIHLRESFLFPPDTDYSQSTLLTIRFKASI